jgi:WD40 repeat protein
MMRSSTPKTFNVFLCHNSEDKAFIRDIAQQLRAQSLVPWLDEEQLIPGRDWLDILEQDIPKIKTVAVFVGHSGLGPWQRREVSAFLREFVEQGTPVIPVLLRNAPEQPMLPLLLKNMGWVDFRRQEPEPFQSLLWGITGNRTHFAKIISKSVSSQELAVNRQPQLIQPRQIVQDSRHQELEELLKTQQRVDADRETDRAIIATVEEKAEERLTPEHSAQLIERDTRSKKRKASDPQIPKEQASSSKAPQPKQTSADFSEVLKLTDAIYSRKTGSRLSDIQYAIVQGAWQSWTYEQIASSNKISPFRVEQSASKFWKILSEAMKEKVTKSTFRAILKKRIQPNTSSRSNNVETSKRNKSSSNTWSWKVLLSFSGHKGWINAIAISRDSQTLVSGGHDCCVKSWNLQTGECKKTFGNVLWDRPHTKPVQAVAIDLNSALVASASEDCTIKVWNLKTGKHLYKPLEHRGAVYSLAISPDNQMIATGCSDQTIKIWGLADGQCHHTFSRHSGAITSVAFSPNGKWLASASEDKTVNIWDLSTRKLSTSLPKYTSSTKFTTFSADGKFLATIYTDRVIRLLDLHTGDIRYELSGEAVAIDHDSKILVSSLDKEIMIWDLLTGELTNSFKGGAGFIRCLSFAPSNQHNYTLVSTHDETIKVWKLERLK